MTNHMEDFTKILKNYTQNLKASNSKIIPTKESKTLDGHNRFYELIAACELVVDKSQDPRDLFALFEDLFCKASIRESSMYFSNEQYDLWFDTIEQIALYYLRLGYNRAYFLLYLHYTNARTHKKDNQSEFEYLQRAFDSKDIDAIAFYAKALYYGNYTLEINREKALFLLQECVDKNNTSAVLFLSEIHISKSTQASEVFDIINLFNPEVFSYSPAIYQLADYYLSVGQDRFALNILLKADQQCFSTCSYLLGVLSCNGQFANFGYTSQQGIEFLEKAFSLGKIEAGFYLAMHLTTNDQDNDQGLYYLTQSSLYGSAESFVALAIQSINTQKQESLIIGYLDQAIALGSSEAMIEKALYLVSIDNNSSSIEQVKQLLQESMDLDNPRAFYQMALFHHEGVFQEDSDLSKALMYFEQAASRKVQYAIEFAGDYHMQGRGTPVNLDKARSYFESAVALFDSSFAKVELANLLLITQPKQDVFDRAITLLKSAFSEGSVYAAYHLGVIYQEQEYTDIDLIQSRKYLQIASDNNLPEALYALACLNLYDDQENLNIRLGMKQLHQALDLGFYKASVELATIYEQGYLSVDSNIALALEYMIIGAQNDIDYAQYKAGYYLLYGYDDVVGNPEQGLYWLEKACKQENPFAMLALGDYYLYGPVAEDSPKAYNYFKMALELDFVTEGIGVCYQFGLGCDKDEKLAFNYYQQASEINNTLAILRLGQAYYFGIGCEQDKEKAFFYLEQASEMDNYEAMDYIGLMLVKGQGCEKNPELGVSYLLQAAQVGYSTSQYELANCYLQGLGVIQSDQIALEWYKQAAENGHSEAMKIVGIPRNRRR